MSLAISLGTFAFSGLMLLVYAMGIHQLPEFTWNDLTGTLLAVFMTTLIVVPILVAYCLLPGYMARMPLASGYLNDAPIGASASSAIALDRQRSRVRFIAGVSVLNVLMWTCFVVKSSSEQLISPYGDYFAHAITVAIITLSGLLLLDWKRFNKQWVRHTLTIFLTGSFTVSAILLMAWAMGPAAWTATMSTPTHVPSEPMDWTLVRDNAFWFGVAVSMVTLVIINLDVIEEKTNKVQRAIFDHCQRCRRVKSFLASTFHFLFGGKDDVQLIAAKVSAIVLFSGFGGTLALIAFNLAEIGNGEDAGRNLIILVLLLSILNWWAFTMDDWKKRLLLGLVTAVLIFGFYPFLVQNPMMFPRMIVSILGLGNERLATVSLSTKQCSTLLPYGVDCVSDDKKSFTLTNVNLLSRVGATTTFELLVRAEKQPAMTVFEINTAAEKNPPKHTDTRELTLLQPLAGKGEGNYMKCDRNLLSKINSKTDRIEADQVRCISLTVPKDQVYGYTKFGTRNYRGNYSGYQAGPDDEPTVIKVVGENAEETIKALSLTNAPSK